jgi:site-specific recombinase XerD
MASITPARVLDADPLSRQEVEALIRACSHRAPTGVRNRALIALLWRGGLRISEALDLHPKDVDVDAGTVVVQRGKGGKRRVVGLDAGAMALVSRWMAVRRKLGVSNRAPLLCTLRGGRIEASYPRHLFPRLARKAGIERRVHPHALRHLCAIEMEREGAPISTIRDTLGHSSVAVTDTYLRRLGAGEAVAFGRSREWGL